MIWTKAWEIIKKHFKFVIGILAINFLGTALVAEVDISVSTTISSNRKYVEFWVENFEDLPVHCESIKLMVNYVNEEGRFFAQREVSIRDITISPEGFYNDLEGGRKIIDAWIAVNRYAEIDTFTWPNAKSDCRLIKPTPDQQGQPYKLMFNANESLRGIDFFYYILGPTDEDIKKQITAPKFKNNGKTVTYYLPKEPSGSMLCSLQLITEDHRSRSITDFEMIVTDAFGDRLGGRSPGDYDFWNISLGGFACIPWN